MVGNESRGTLLIHIYFFLNFKVFKILCKVFPPVWETGLIFNWKTAKIDVFRIRPLLAKKRLKIWQAGQLIEDMC